MNGICHRDNFGSLLNQLNLKGKGVEVGCAFGGNARLIMSQWEGECLYMVDPWIAQDANVYREKQEPPGNYDRWYAACQGFAGEMKGRVKLIKEYSANAAGQFEDGSLDFIYLDGNHDLPHVEEDIRLWVPKVKSGGVVSGHDFYDHIGSGLYNEVFTGVCDWAAREKVAVERWVCSSWVAIKP